jgi:hypothetical protein
MNLIYQFYSGNIPYYARVSKKLMSAYAEQIGCEYRCDFNSTGVSANNNHYHNCFRPIHDKAFDKYDNVLFCDMDVFPVEGITENVFDQPITNFGIVEEDQQPDLRYSSNGEISGKNDEKWAAIVKRAYGYDLPRDEQNRLRVFNSGVVLYTREGIELAKRKWADINSYQSIIHLNRFYQLDQNYLGAMLGGAEFTVMDRKWNAQMHYLGDPNQRPRPIFDSRSEDTNFVHIQLRGRDKLNDDRIYDIVNKPISEWRHART